MPVSANGSYIEPNIDPIIRLPKVCEVTGCSRAFIYAKIKEGTFPQGISIGAKSKGWLLSEVQAWINERVAESRKGGAV